jgi:hypothetical protein
LAQARFTADCIHYLFADIVESTEPFVPNFASGSSGQAIQSAFD